jgi:hypothetical protein
MLRRMQRRDGKRNEQSGEIAAENEDGIRGREIVELEQRVPSQGRKRETGEIRPFPGGDVSRGLGHRGCCGAAVVDLNS